jgi:hypothetical protein
MNNNLCCQTLFEASARGYNNCLLNLLDHGIGGKFLNIDEQDNMGWTPLHIAVSAHRVNIVKTLLDRGCNYRLPDKHGQTAKDHVIEILENSYWDDAYDYADYADIKKLLSYEKNLTVLNNTKFM